MVSFNPLHTAVEQHGSIEKVEGFNDLKADDKARSISRSRFWSCSADVLLIHFFAGVNESDDPKEA